ncbi:DUF6090 family protein [Gaetbulibacter sp. M240]|uniref:DUF6090 family protein n=1 Tax=Gaetbulibacter sp. M240 TaxID=3126511 RepID=UPI00374ECEBC
MIKFFRHFRQNLLSEGNTVKYLKYAIGEIILVVIGILIALQINNWNEDRKIEDIKQNYYQQLIADMEADKEYAENIIIVLDSSIKKYNDYRETFKRPFVNFETTYKTVGINSFNTKSLEFKTNSIQSLINTGDIKLLAPNLRERLTQFNASKMQALNISKNNNDDANSILQSAMMSGGSVESNLQGQPELLAFLDLEKKRPEIFLKLEAYFSWKIFGENATIRRFQKLIEEADILKDLLKTELEK